MLVPVVGPSGAGKDTLLDAARAALVEDRRYRFVRRVITRPAGAGGEQHESVTADEFAKRHFALRWNAHGIDYGIPESIKEDVAAGRAVVVSASRTVIAAATSHFIVRVIEVTAPPDILAARLRARGRETAQDMARRLSRRVTLPDGVPVESVVNDTTLNEGTARFLSALSRAAAGAQR